MTLLSPLGAWEHLGLFWWSVGRTLNLRATRCDRSQPFEGIQPDSKLVGGLMRLVQALSGASELSPSLRKLTRTGCSCGEHFEGSQLSLKLEGGLKRLDQYYRGTQNLAQVGR